MWRFQKYWVGLVFIGLGIVLLAAQMDWLPVEIKQNVWPLVWPVFVIIMGGSWLLGQLGGRLSWFSITVAAMVTAYGVMGLLHGLGLTTFEAFDVFAQGWPVFILAIGLEMLFSGSRRPRVRVNSRSGSRVYVGRVGRENGSWNVRWDDVTPTTGVKAGTAEADAQPEVLVDEAASADDDGTEEADPDNPTGSDSGAHTYTTDGGPRQRSGRTTGFRNQTRVAGEVRIGNYPWDLEPDTVFNLGAGEVDIDLSTARIGPGENDLTIRLWAGQVTIYVPSDLAIAVETKLTAGQISIFGEDYDGLGPSVSYRSDDYDEAERKVNIHIDMMFGQVDVKEAR